VERRGAWPSVSLLIISYDTFFSRLMDLPHLMDNPTG
jgi:hypothetical protein